MSPQDGQRGRKRRVMLEWLKRSAFASGIPRHQLAILAASWLVIVAMTACVLAPTLGTSNTVGAHDWDQMESHRYLVMKTIRLFHQFPFWNPYACGGHSNWGGFESGTIVVSPWLPFYLTMTLPHAMRVEVWGSALLSAIGAWLLAGRFALSPAARAFVVVVFAVNGRWALQLSSGHTWHLAYAWTPWTLYFYDRALGADPTRGGPRRRDVVLCASCIAAMAYAGGIYPLPHTVLAVALYGAFVGALDKSYRPLLVWAAASAMAFGLAAPKVLPVLEVMARYPRVVESPEALDVTTFLQILTSRDQDVGSHATTIDTPWGWHEFGMYVGWPVLLAITIAVLIGRGTRESSLKWVGLFFVIVGFGTFDPHAPWPIIHHLPIFKSQHVPSRWQYPALLLLLTLTAAVIDQALRRAGEARRMLEFALLAAVACVACDLGVVARRPLMHTFATSMPTTPESTGPFHTEVHLPEDLAYTVNYAPLTLSAELANIGTIECATFPGLNSSIRDSRGRTVGLGARGRGDPEYRGESYIAEGAGQTFVEKWTPNEVTIAVHGARAGEHVVLNQNWDGGWTANGARATNLDELVAAELSGGDATIVFEYRPRSWWLGVIMFLATAGGIGWAYWALGRSRPCHQRATHWRSWTTNERDVVDP